MKATTITPTAAAVQPLKPALDDPSEHYMSLRIDLTYHRAALCGCWLQREADGAVRLFHCALHDSAPSLLAENARLRALLTEAAGLADETAGWLTGGESYEPEVLADALTKLAMDCRTSQAQPLKVLVEVRGGVAYLTECPTGVEVEIVDHDNEKVGL